jgi:uncharacterized membrane protein YedE/YeeE
MWQTDWIPGLIGGLMIGLAGVVLLIANGRVMGASGILGGLADGTGRGNAGERLTFVAALAGAPAVVSLAGHAPDTHATPSVGLLVLAGLLVGIGTRIGNGCTSGHGVCGISRLSKRSFAATLFYLLAGGATMLVARHLLAVI